MNKLNAFTSILTLVVLTPCSKKDAGSTNSSQATMNVQEAKSTAKDIPYKSEIEKGLTLQFELLKMPHGKIETYKANVAGNHLIINGETTAVDFDPDKYMEDLVGFQNIELITIRKTYDSTQDPLYNSSVEHKTYDVEWTQKAIGLRDIEHSDTNWLRISLGVCKVQTIVKDTEYNYATGPAAGSNRRLVMGTYEVKFNDFARSNGGTNAVFKFRAVIKSNPFNQTYSYVTGDRGSIDSDDWETQNVTQ